MQIVHLSTDIGGGAGIAALRLHRALLQAGLQSKIITKYGNVTDDTHHVIGATTLVNKVAEKLGFLPNWKIQKAETLKKKPPGFEIFSLPYGTIDLSKHPWIQQADIIHLHWVSDGYINLETLFQLPKQFVWTLHDMNPFTGGCHHADGCLQFENDCSKCPQLHIKQQYLAADAFLFKQKVLKYVGNKLQIIAPSKWLLQLSVQSKLFSDFRHTQIYNLIAQ
ncbi:MAG TPA: hypothetical protein PLO59_02780, partial [Bacteroidia bacterium]|nr:hypothetical protein [Bacteroidia bacterium]